MLAELLARISWGDFYPADQRIIIFAAVAILFLAAAFIWWGFNSARWPVFVLALIVSMIAAFLLLQCCKVIS